MTNVKCKTQTETELIKIKWNKTKQQKNMKYKHRTNLVSKIICLVCVYVCFSFELQKMSGILKQLKSSEILYSLD